MAVIDITPFLKKKPKPNRAYGERLCCPNCDAYDYWRPYAKPHVDKTLHLTAFMCTSDECDGTTVVEVKNGMLIK